MMVQRGARLVVWEKAGRRWISLRLRARGGAGQGESHCDPESWALPFSPLHIPHILGTSSLSVTPNT